MGVLLNQHIVPPFAPRLGHNCERKDSHFRCCQPQKQPDRALAPWPKAPLGAKLFVALFRVFLLAFHAHPSIQFSASCILARSVSKSDATATGTRAFAPRPVGPLWARSTVAFCLHWLVGNALAKTTVQLLAIARVNAMQAAPSKAASAA